MALIIWLVLFIVGYLGFLKAFSFVLTRFERPASRLAATIVITIPLAVAFASPLYYEFPNYGFSKVVTFDGDCATERELGAFAWEFGGTFSNVPTSNTDVTGTLSFATETRGIRTLRYHIGARIVDPALFFADHTRRHMFATTGENAAIMNRLVAGDANNMNRSVKGEITDLVARQMFEFNNIFSGGLAVLNNPLDPVQQEAFKALIECFINTNLAYDGIAVRASSFTLE